MQRIGDVLGDVSFKVEAEALSFTDLVIESIQAASGAQVLSHAGTANYRDPGSATYTHTEVAGRYRLSLDLFDEGDGEGTIEVLVNAFPLQTFTLDSQDGANSATANSLRKLTMEVDLNPDDQLTFITQADRGEPVRFDRIGLQRIMLDIL